MNNHAEYRRHAYNTEHHSEPPGEASGVEAAHHLATHRDPSLVPAQNNREQATTDGTSRRIAWVRPTEFHSFAAPTLVRGIDLHAELVRRLRRSPAEAARSVRRSMPTRSAQPQPTPTPEGPSL
ncbi:MAG: hypothetical protein ACXVHX_02145 [Solirubrobacteraceae bacterium]